MLNESTTGKLEQNDPHVCPYCGTCKTCGRPPWFPFISYPPIWQQPYPAYPGGTNPWNTPWTPLWTATS